MFDTKVTIDERVNETIEGWLKEDLSDIKNYNYSNEQIKKLIASYIEKQKKQVNFILDKDLKKDEDYSKEYFSLFTNSSNTKTKTIFNILTGIDAGKTIKKSKEVFSAYFGTHLDELASMEKQKEQVEIENAKNAKIDSEKAYFDNAIWDSEQIFNLTPLQRGRLKKSLDKLFNFDGVIRSLKEQLEHICPTSKDMANNMHKWNRRKYNRMDGDEQRDYDKKLIKGRTYYCGDYTIPKVVFDVLNLTDETNKEQLAS